jgi:hypothetical protein
MHRIAARATEPADGRLADAGGERRRLPAQLHHRAIAFDRARPQFERSRIADELAACGAVGVGKERRHRYFDEIRIAVERLAVGIGKLRAFDRQMDKVRPGRVEAIERKALEQRELLQHHRALAPRAGFAHRVAAVIVGQRRFDAWRPTRHVGAVEDAAMASAA